MDRYAGDLLKVTPNATENTAKTAAQKDALVQDPLVQAPKAKAALRPSKKTSRELIQPSSEELERDPSAAPLEHADSSGLAKGRSGSANPAADAVSASLDILAPDALHLSQGESDLSTYSGLPPGHFGSSFLLAQAVTETTPAASDTKAAQGPVEAHSSSSAPISWAWLLPLALLGGGSSKSSTQVNAPAPKEPEPVPGNPLPETVTRLRVVDGPVKDAKVFVDLNGDGVISDDEPEVGSTDSTGFANLTLTAQQATLPLLAKGGTDTETNKAFAGVLAAPAGSAVINPLTTLVAALMEGGQSLADAKAGVVTALGLTGVSDLTSYDTFAQASTPEGMANHLKAVQIANIIVAGAALAASDNTAAAQTGAASRVIDALAAKIASTSGSVTFNAAVLTEVLTTAGATSHAASVAAAIESVNTLVANATGPNALAQVAQAQVLAQVTLTNAIQTAATGGLDTVTALQDSTTAAQMASQIDLSIPDEIAPAPAPAPVPDPAPDPTSPPGNEEDTLAPSLTITSDKDTLKVGESATITFTFSEDPGTSFAWDGSAGDITVTGGALSAITGSGLLRTAVFTPTPNLESGSASITVGSASYADAAGNAGGAGTSPAISIDTLAPTLKSVTEATTAATTKDPISFTVTFSEALTDTLDTNNFTASDGAVTSVSQIGTSNAYTVVVTPTAGLASGTVALSLVGTGLADAAGNPVAQANLADMASQSVDTLAPNAPTLALGTGVANGATLAEVTAAGGVVTVTAETDASTVVTFSRSGGGTVSKSVTGNGATPVAVTLSSAELTTLGNGSISVNAVTTDAAGNATNSTGTTSFTMDSTPPTFGVSTAGISTSFEESSLISALELDIPNPSLATITLDTTNDELDFSASGNTNMWGSRQDVPIAYVMSPQVGLNQSWSVETKLRINDVGASRQVAGLTFYSDADGAKPTFTFGLEGWNAGGNAPSYSGLFIALEALGSGRIREADIYNADSVYLKVEVTEKGASDDYRFFYKQSSSDPWTQHGGSAYVLSSSADNARTGLWYKTESAKPGAAFDELNLVGGDGPAWTVATSTIAGTAGNSAGETITLTLTFDDDVNGLTTGSNSTIFTVAGSGVNATWSGTDGSNTRSLTYTVASNQNGQAAIDEAALKAALIAGITDAAGNAFAYSANGGDIPNIDSTALPVVDTQAPTATLTAGTGTNTSNATVQSSEVGTAYLVKTGGASPVTVTSLASITGADGAKWNSVATSTASTATNLSLTGLEDGSYSLYSVDAAGNLSVAASNTFTVDSTAPSLIVTPAAGSQSVIDLGGAYGKLIAPMQAGGNWFYYWDRDGNGAANEQELFIEEARHNFLDTFFRYDSSLNATNPASDTSDVYRFATLAGLTLALPSVQELQAVRAQANGLPTGWLQDPWGSYYWTATPGSSTDTHAAYSPLTDGLIADATDSYMMGVALRVISSAKPGIGLTQLTGAAGNSAGETITLTLTFDENVSGLSSGTNSTIFTVAGTGVSAAWSGTGNSRTLTYTIAAEQNGQAAIDEAALKTALIAGITDAAGNAFAYSGSIPNIDASALPVVDTFAPTLSSTAPTTALGAALAGTAGNSAGETITLTLTFDGNVNGLTTGSNSTIFTVGGSGVNATWAGTDGTNTRTLTYTITAGQNGLAAINEAALKTALIAGITDAAGNAFAYTANSGNIPDIDSTALPVVDNRSLVAYWKMDESTGSVAYDSGPNNLNATFAQNASWAGTGAPGFATNKSVSLNNGYLQVADSSLFNLTSGFTISAWAKTTDGANNTIIDRANYNFLVQIAPNGTSGLGFYNNATDWRYSSTPIAVNEWVHVAVSYDPANATIKFYKNGILTDTFANIPTLTFNPGAVNIGAQLPEGFSGNRMDGQLDEVAIFDTALSQPQISSFMQGSGANHPVNLDLGSLGQLIAPVQVEGKWYYHLDRNGDGTIAGDTYTMSDANTHPLSEIYDLFKQDINGVAGASTNDTYRYATVNGVKLALPTLGTSPIAGLMNGTALNNATQTNPSYDDLSAIWDAYNGTLVGSYSGQGLNGSNRGSGNITSGAPAAWVNDSYVSATPWPSSTDYAALRVYDGLVFNHANWGMNVALQVL
jgi:hypothetical protein